jgi:hypothetical protein
MRRTWWRRDFGGASDVRCEMLAGLLVLVFPRTYVVRWIRISISIRIRIWYGIVYNGS